MKFWCEHCGRKLLKEGERCPRCRQVQPRFNVKRLSDLTWRGFVRVNMEADEKEVRR